MKPSFAVVNKDDEWGVKMASATSSTCLTYSATQAADVKAENIELSIEGTRFQVSQKGETHTVSSPLVGRFNVYNILAAFSTGIALGLPKADIQKGIVSLASVKGRFERAASPKGWSAIIDYAHTPDALEKCLRALHEILPAQNRGRIITVFGAGGDRDKTKRPWMGKIVSELSDVVIITSDNPRTEEPNAIIEDIARGIKNQGSVQRQVDRKRAIEQATKMASKGDVVLIAGKGHEEYQVLGKEKIHFSDREVVEQFL